MDTRVLLAFLVPVALASACSSKSSGSGSTQQPVANAPPLLQLDCDPMVPGECGFPFPSSVWTVPDTTTKTGVHLYFGDTTLPKYTPSKHMDKTPWLGRDGFSPGAAMITYMQNGTTTGLPDAYHIDQSMAPTCPTIIMEADTGARVPHWAEYDSLNGTYNDDIHGDERSFFIRPAVRLKDATRYIVAVRNVVDPSGTPLPANPVFQALRDNTPSDDISVAPRRALYADIMGKLQAQGVDTSTLQIAWDFTTASKDDTTKYMVKMRDDALATVGADGPKYTITTVTENPNQFIRRRIVGNMTVPLYLDKPGPGSSLHLGADGLPTQNGTADFPFLIQIPNSLVNSGKAGAIIQNAHGLFGDRGEGQDGYMAETCDREGYVEIAVNLVGMDDEDGSTYVPNMLAGDLAQFQHLVDRLHQGFLNELLAMRMMMGKMAQDPMTIFNGKPTIDPTTRFYRGDSQGGISGGVYMAISTDVTRGLLGEPGAPYNILLDRSADFNGFFLIIRGIYQNPLDIQLGLDIIQSLWDRAEPDGYISYISSDLLPNTPSHNILIHDGIGDQQVTPLGAHFLARTVGAQNLKAVNREVYGIPDADSGFSGNGIVEWNFGLPPGSSPVTNTPPDPSQPDPHDALRQQADAQDMSDVFFRTGTVVQTCPNGGPCAAPSTWASGGLLPPPPDGGTFPEGGNDEGGAVVGDGGVD
ncbi:MAG TPA: hypothetical protein VIF15_02750 [Polyangiaceae bacterium]